LILTNFSLALHSTKTPLLTYTLEDIHLMYPCLFGHHKKKILLVPFAPRATPS